MIIGECPYDDCDGPLFIPIADECPSFEKHDCETCKRIIWTYHSHWDPHSYTEEGFYKVYKVNEEAKTIAEI